MVDVNTTRATSKKIKDSSAAKTRNEDTSIANSLIPGTGSGSTMEGSDVHTQATNNGRALNGNISNPSGTTQETGTPERVERNAGEEVHSLLVDTSKSRRDRAPAALLYPPTKAKTGVPTKSRVIEEEEEDRSPAIAAPSIMSERQQMWDRAISAQDAGDNDLAEMLFKAIGRIGKSAPKQLASAGVFAIPT
ncbi:hypothetical protein PGT21_004700 [Puccinia graminis f. sp. tritici]|uniref:Uncharacterized protein n=1 Tax=Puccinia graminis f. sp. tritici TaxID=56615 RepID=A0A5B0PM46_PUCGR|nr:hypothetical protein PGT21_004700 [Puccinia graminis f. sp. tritici]